MYLERQVSKHVNYTQHKTHFQKLQQQKIPNSVYVSLTNYILYIVPLVCIWSISKENSWIKNKPPFHFWNAVNKHSSQVVSNNFYLKQNKQDILPFFIQTLTEKPPHIWTRFLTAPKRPAWWSPVGRQTVHSSAETQQIGAKVSKQAQPFPGSCQLKCPESKVTLYRGTFWTM